MSLLRFAHFTFDTATLELRASSRQITLRPKTAELLRELIVGRENVLDKRTLISRIWHTEYVTDQSVFQAMSELRRKLAPLKPIRTFPNRGYQWVLSIEEQKSKRRPMALAVAATLLLAIVAVTAVHQFADPDESSQTAQSVAATDSLESSVLSAQSLPAMTAFSDGAAALQRGDTRLALDYLNLSVAERPDFVEARLLLAEAYLLHGDALQARQRADDIMNSLTAGSAYATIAAMDLLSRADQNLGQMNSALEWATKAADEANTNGYECTAADLHDRVLALVQDYDYSVTQLEASPVFASAFARRLLQSALAAQELADHGQLAQSPLSDGALDAPLDGLLGQNWTAERPAHCERYRGGPSGQLNQSESFLHTLAQHLVTSAIYKPLI